MAVVVVVVVVACDVAVTVPEVINSVYFIEIQPSEPLNDVFPQPFEISVTVILSPFGIVQSTSELVSGFFLRLREEAVIS